MVNIYIALISLVLILSLLLVLIRVKEILKQSKRLDEKLKEERDRANAIVSSMGEGLLVLDTNYKIVLINPAAEKLLETTANEAVRQKWAEFVQAYIGKKQILFEKRSSVKVLKSGKVIITTVIDDHYYKTRSGRKFPVVSITAPLLRNGAVTGVVKLFHDVTREKEIDRMKTEFISLASHQLRTPLSALKWFTELLMEKNYGSLTDEQKEFVKNIADSTERMISLVNSLLNISRIESGRIIIDPKPTDLNELVNKVLKELEEKIKNKKINIIFSIHQQLPLINTDPKLIRHVYMNLIDNAIKYSPTGGEISIIVSKKDDQIISQISDNGYGIPKNQHYKIFQKFFRGVNVIKHETEGSGLGLYLVKAIIDSSEGKIWFKSEEKKGTTFWFSLPIVGSKPKTGEVSLDAETK